jgi:hypothetical protein
LNKAISNINETWAKIFDKVPQNAKNMEITKEELGDPKNPIVEIILWSYTAESFLYSTLN